MITNVWSTPRTGSVWYSMWWARQHGLVRVNEMFNQYYMHTYREVQAGSVLTHTEWAPLRVHDEYSVVDGMLHRTVVDTPRTRTREQEHAYRIHLLHQLNPSQPLLFHNHVAPIDESVRDYLTRIAHTNIYTWRQDRLAQCASYAIAYATRVFAQFTPRETVPLQSGMITEIDMPSLRNLVARIRTWDTITKHGRCIAYEDMPFNDTPLSTPPLSGLPVKQIADYTTVLAPSACEQIRELLVDWGLV